MRHGSLFSGGGGFDLAAEMTGWQNIFHCEKDQFCQKVLGYYWPEATCISDIKEFDGTPYRGSIDVISGGFPCQPFSAAGKRKGTSDDRYLWPEMLRVIKQVQPRWVVGENVYGLLSWNGGLVFDTVQLDLEIAGYEVTAFILPAAGINAPHQRYRVWIVGHNPANATEGQAKNNPNAHSHRWHSTDTCREGKDRRNRRKRQHLVLLRPAELEKVDSNAYGDGCDISNSADEKFPSEAGDNAQRHPDPMDQLAATGNEWNNWPAQSPLCGGDDGLSPELDGIAFQKWREQSLKLYGNAIVPQIAARIFKAIDIYETDNRSLPG